MGNPTYNFKYNPKLKFNPSVIEEFKLSLAYSDSLEEKKKSSAKILHLESKLQHQEADALYYKQEYLRLLSESVAAETTRKLELTQAANEGALEGARSAVEANPIIGLDFAQTFIERSAEIAQKTIFNMMLSLNRDELQLHLTKKFSSLLIKTVFNGAVDIGSFEPQNSATKAESVSASFEQAGNLLSAQDHDIYVDGADTIVERIEDILSVALTLELGILL